MCKSNCFLDDKQRDERESKTFEREMKVRDGVGLCPNGRSCGYVKC